MTKNNQLSNFFYIIYNFFMRYPTPPNLGSTWNFGVAAIFFFVVQLVTGIFLSMSYVASADLAFLSVENIMRNINYGWLIRYMHSNGASFFFLCVYLHTLRNMYYSSFNSPRRNVWNVGVILLLLMIITAFTGYVLPWGQMSFRAATVITNLFSAIPVFGDYIVIWLWGAFAVSTSTLNRFFSFHFILPFLMLFFIGLHIIFLHERGSSNRMSFFFFMDKLFFHPFFTSKDLNFMYYIVCAYVFIIGFYPNYLGHPDNYIQADPLLTPAHIVPEWYFLPFYAILRSVPSKLGGVLVLFISIGVLFIFPLLTNYKGRPVKDLISPKYFILENSSNIVVKILLLLKRNKTAIHFWFFVVICVLLGILGAKSTDYPYLDFSRIVVLCYFAYFIFFVRIRDFFNNFKNFTHLFMNIEILHGFFSNLSNDESNYIYAHDLIDDYLLNNMSFNIFQLKNIY